MQENLSRTKNELILLNYSKKTIKSYLYSLSEYFKFKKCDLNKCDQENIRRFLMLKYEKNLSSQTINSYLSAIKFYYRKIIRIYVDFNIHFAKKPKKLPVVFSKNEVKLLIDSLENIKHKTLIALAYGAGLRVSEVVKLKICDTDFIALVISIKGGKGNKDRISIIPEFLVKNLKILSAGKLYSDYLFPSERGGRLNERTAQKIFEKALKYSGIQKRTGFHSLRHSFATHLLEDGVDVRYIQALLGHANIQTTQRYTKVTNPAIRNIKSPLS